MVYILQVIVHIHITYILDKRRKQKVEEYNIYSDIAQRSQGDVYIGVVGPVRTGKSTFIKMCIRQREHDMNCHSPPAAERL